MRRVVKGSLVSGLGLIFASYVMAYRGSYTPGSGISGTVHDLATAHNGMNYTASPQDGQQRICIFCHAPGSTYGLSPANGGREQGLGGGLQAPDDFDYLPLWNHDLTANSSAYQMYQNGPGAPQMGPRASQAIAESMDPGSSSLLCLSCHDGSIAINAYGNSSQSQTSRSGGGSMIGTTYAIGQDNYLGNHHPVGILYAAGQTVDGDIRSADIARLGRAGLVRDHLYGSGNGKIECGTCHSVHNTGNTGESLLWRSDTNSRLCLTCHDKGTDPGSTTP